MSGAVWLLAFVTAARLAELVHARRNTRALLAAGAREFAPGHYPLIVAVHAGWLAGLWAFGTGQPVAPAWLAVFAALQVGRVWVLATLGRRWTTRIIVTPGEDLVRRGPYRFVAHPNYIIVAGEIAVVPLCLGLWGIAAAFSVLNGMVLMVRLRAETAALALAAPPVAGMGGQSTIRKSDAVRRTESSTAAK